MMETPQPLWATCVSDQLPSQLKNCVQTGPPAFQFVSIASGPFTGYHWEESASVFCTPSLQIFIHSDKTPLNLHFSRMKSPRHFVQYVHISFVLWSPELITALHVCLASTE